MTVEHLVFAFFSALMLGSAVLVVTSRNLFHAGLYLIVSLFAVAGLFVLLLAWFLAGVQVVIYVGAIAILIILAIMVTPQVTQMPNILNEQWPVNLLLAGAFFLLLVSVVTPLMDEWNIHDTWNASFVEDDPQDIDAADDVAQLGEDFVDPERFMLPFEVASLLLMAALIGSVLIVNPRDPDGAPEPELDTGTD